MQGGNILVNKISEVAKNEVLTSAVGGADEAEAMGRRLSPDVLLEAARRVDWRFLLPSIALDKVAYLGPAEGSLFEALRLFSRSLTLLEKIGERAQHGRYQVVVAHDPSYQGLQAASMLVEQGGSLYVEAYGLTWSFRHLKSLPHWLRLTAQRLGFPQAYRRVIEQVGFEEVRAFWHWPSFETCTKVIPLDEPSAARYALNQAGSGRQARLEKALGIWLLESGLLGMAAPCFSIVARKVHA